MDRALRRQIELELKAQGFSGAAKDIHAIYAEVQRLIGAGKLAANDIGAIIAKISQLTAAYAQQAAAAKKSAEAQKAAIGMLSNAFGQLDKGVNTALKSIIGFASFDGFVSAAKNSMGLLKQYNDNILQSGAAAARYGIGITQIESKLNSLSNTLSLTKAETQKLFKQYEQSFGSFSMRGFEGVLKNIQKVVGPSSEAMGDMMGKLSGVLAKMPDLQVQMERMGAKDKVALQLSAQRLLAVGQLSVAEYKALTTYITQSDQASAADKKRQRELLANQRTFQEFSRQSERIGLMLAQALMPIFTRIADWLKENQGPVKSFFDHMADGVKFVTDHAKVLMGILTGLVAIWAGGRIFAMASGALGVGRMAINLIGGLGGGGGGLGAAASAGGGGLLSRLMGGGVGGGGFFGGIGRNATASMGTRFATAGRFGIGALALGAAGQGLDMVQDNQAEKGNYKTAGLAGLGAAGAKVGSYAMTGAALGSIIPGIGTGIGAGVGAVIGIISSSKQLKESFDRLTGRNKEELERQAKFDASISQGTANAHKFLAQRPEDDDQDDSAHEKALQKKIEDATQSVRETPLSAQGFLINQSSLQETQSKVEAKQKEADQALSAHTINYEGQTYSASDDRNGSTLSREDFAKKTDSARNRMAKIQETIGNTSDPEKKNALAQEYKILQEQQETQEHLLDELNKAHDKIQDTIPGLKEMTDQMKVQQAIKTAQLEMLNREQLLTETLSQYAQKTSSYYDTLLTRAQKVGDVSGGAIDAAMHQAIEANDKQKDQLFHLKSLQEAIGTGQMLSADMSKEKVAWEKEHNTQLINAKQLDTDILDKTQKMVDSDTQITAMRVKRVAALEGELGILASESGLLEKNVQLSDNMAIGVGASVKMREATIASYNLQIGKLKEMLTINEQQQKEYGASHGGQIALDIANQRLEIEGKIFDKQSQMAAMNKAMADGWISAIGAMNTGAGRFTKIMVSQEQGATALLNRFKAVSSNTLGATRNAGQGLGQSVGYNNSTSFTGQEGVLTQQTGGALGGAVAFDVGRGETSAGLVQSAIRGDVRGTAQGLADEATRRYNAGGFAGSAALNQAQGAGISTVAAGNQGTRVIGGPPSIPILPGAQNPYPSPGVPNGYPAPQYPSGQVIVQGGQAAFTAQPPQGQPVPFAGGNSAADQFVRSAIGQPAAAPPSAPAVDPVAVAKSKVEAQQAELEKAKTAQKAEEDARAKKIKDARDDLDRKEHKVKTSENQWTQDIDLLNTSGSAIHKRGVTGAINGFLARNFDTGLPGTNVDEDAANEMVHSEALQNKAKHKAEYDRAWEEKEAAKKNLADIEASAGGGNSGKVTEAKKRVEEAQKALDAANAEKKKAEEEKKKQETAAKNKWIENTGNAGYKQYVGEESQSFEEKKAARIASAQEYANRKDNSYSKAAQLQKQIEGYSSGSLANTDKGRQRVAELTAKKDALMKAEGLDPKELERRSKLTKKQSDEEHQTRLNNATLNATTASEKGRGHIDSKEEYMKKHMAEWEVQAQKELAAHPLLQQMIAPGQPGSAGTAAGIAAPPASATGGPGIVAANQPVAAPQPGAANGPAVTPAGQSAAAPAAEPTTINYAIPSLVINVHFDQLGDIREIISEAARRQIASQGKYSSLGDDSKKHPFA